MTPTKFFDQGGTPGRRVRGMLDLFLDLFLVIDHQIRNKCSTPQLKCEMK
jgi:hypothetical protein